MNNPMFRKEAMERLSSPDQLDQLITVTTTRGWFALLALGLVLTVTILWGIFGSVSTQVAGDGLLLLQQGVFSAFAESEGRVRTMAVKEGESIAAGAVIATLYSEAMEKKIEGINSRLRNYRREQERELETDRTVFESFSGFAATRKRQLQADISKWLAEKLANQEELYRDKLITLQTLHATRRSINDAETEVNRLDDELKQRKAALDEKTSKTAAEIRMLEEELELEKTSMRNLTHITASRPGTIVRLETKTGAIVAPGQRIAFLEEERRTGSRETSTHDVVIYVSAGEGKRIRPGMEVQVVPGTVKAEEYGVMLGQVVSVSAFPVSYHAMLRVLENPELVQNLIKNGPLFEVWVDLHEDPANPSGFRWSSRNGPPLSIQSGTPCFANVVVRRQAPFSLVIPFLQEVLFGRVGER